MQTVAVLFSKNRALQLDAALRSFFRHCQDPRALQIQVLYKTTDSEHEASYARLVQEYPEVTFVGERNFREQLIAMLTPAAFVLFIVDDTLFVRGFAVEAGTRLLNSTPELLGFSLRLGPNTDFCYMAGAPQPLPSFLPVEGQLLSFDWTVCGCDFGYPLEVSSSLYRTADILPLLHTSSFSTPNLLEYCLSCRAVDFKGTRPRLLCHDPSIAFCVPINLVQTDFAGNRHGQSFPRSAEELNRSFQAGLRVDVSRYDGWVPKACHQEVPLYLGRP